MKNNLRKPNLSQFENTLSYILFEIPENKFKLDNATSITELLNNCKEILRDNIDSISDKKKIVELLTNISAKTDYISALTYLYNFYLKGDNLEVLSI